MGRVFFLRHLETANNAKQLICGRSPAQPIAKEEIVFSLHSVDLIYCSDALRCRQTIDCYLKTHPKVPVQYTKLLYERDMGIWEGELKSSIVKSNPELFVDGRFRLFSTPPSGESYVDFKNRAYAVLNLMLKEKGNILICSHNQFLKMLLLILSKTVITQEVWNSIDLPYGQILSLEELFYKNKKYIRRNPAYIQRAYYSERDVLRRKKRLSVPQLADPNLRRHGTNL